MRSLKKTLFLATLFVLAAGLLIGSTLWAADPDDSNFNKKAWLGIYMQDVGDDVAEALGLKIEEGVLINKVIEKSPADKAGLRDGDVIVRVEEIVIADSDDLSREIKEHKPGDKIEVVIWRDGEKQTYNVELGESERKKDYEFSLKAPRPEKLFFNFEGKPYGYLGVGLQSLGDQLAEYFQVEDGALVSEVIEESPAEKAGLKAGDVIVAVNGTEIDDASDVTEVIRDHKKGDKIEIEVVRDGNKMNLMAELDEREFPHNFESLFGQDGIAIPNLSGMEWHFDPDELNIQLDELKEQFGPEFRQKLQESMDELREELDQLREELKQLQEELQE